LKLWWIFAGKSLRAAASSAIPNLWCDEHSQPRYIIDLLKRIISLSLETMKIVKALPKLGL